MLEIMGRQLVNEEHTFLWLSRGDLQGETESVYTGCPRRNVKYFGRVFLESNYTDITQNTYIQS